MGSLSANINLPFQPEELDDDDDVYSNYESSALYRMLPANAKEYVAQSPHLLEYLQMFPVNLYGIPLFFSELKRDLKSMENPNVIYPTCLVDRCIDNLLCFLGCEETGTEYYV